MRKSPERKRDEHNGGKGRYEGGKYDDRARSYRGVVINGNGGTQTRERDNRDHYGKGKGKMVEEPDHKWRKVNERGSRRGSKPRGIKGDEEGSRYRGSRVEEPRVGAQEGSSTRRAESPKQVHGALTKDTTEAGVEEGELKENREQTEQVPSQQFQAELANTQAEGGEVISNPGEIKEGVEAVKSLVEEHNNWSDEEEMDMDTINACLREHGIDPDATDDLQEFAEEMMEERSGDCVMEEGIVAVEDENTATELQENKSKKKENKESKGIKKKPFMLGPSVAGSSKPRAAASLLEARKRGTIKTGARTGDSSKQAENKGTAAHKVGLKKI